MSCKTPGLFLVVGLEITFFQGFIQVRCQWKPRLVYPGAIAGHVYGETSD